jgi:hypothetical protein
MRMRRFLLTALCVLGIYLAILPLFTDYMSHRRLDEKLGLVPRPEVLKSLFPDYQELVCASMLTRVMLYFGSILDAAGGPRQGAVAADYPAMSRFVHAALELDPYNMDGYYFGQAILVWDAGRYQLANELLEYGMKYRTWDWQLPYFAGFNYAYFLHDRQSAARMYMRAGELSGEPMFQSLAGRYLQEGGHTQMAIDYLRAMEKGARNAAIRKSFQVRVEAFRAVLAIERARDRFIADRGVSPTSIDELVTAGYIPAQPADPYGGHFYLDEEKNVRSSSRFSFARPAGPESVSPAQRKDGE